MVFSDLRLLKPVFRNNHLKFILDFESAVCTYKSTFFVLTA